MCPASTHYKTREGFLERNGECSPPKELRPEKDSFLMFLSQRQANAEVGYTSSGLNMEQPLGVTKCLAVHELMRQEEPGQHKLRGPLF